MERGQLRRFENDSVLLGCARDLKVSVADLDLHDLGTWMKKKRVGYQNGSLACMEFEVLRTVLGYGDPSQVTEYDRYRVRRAIGGGVACAFDTLDYFRWMSNEVPDVPLVISTAKQSCRIWQEVVFIDGRRVGYVQMQYTLPPHLRNATESSTWWGRFVLNPISLNLQFHLKDGSVLLPMVMRLAYMFNTPHMRPLARLANQEGLIPAHLWPAVTMLPSPDYRISAAEGYVALGGYRKIANSNTRKISKLTISVSIMEDDDPVTISFQLPYLRVKGPSLDNYAANTIGIIPDLRQGRLRLYHVIAVGQYRQLEFTVDCVKWDKHWNGPFILARPSLHALHEWGVQNGVW